MQQTGGRRSRAGTALVLAAAAAASACTAGGASSSTASSSTSSSSSSASSSAPSTSSSSSTGTSASPDVGGAGRGSAGVGDPLFADLGNGGYDVRHYSLDLRYATADPSGPVTERVTVQAVATQPLSRFDLDFSGERIGAVTVGGRPAAVTRQGSEVVVTPASPVASGAAFTVVLSGVVARPRVPTKDFTTTYFFSTPSASAWAGQPDRAHQIFPGNDHPSDPATYSFRIDVPAGTTAVANGVLTGRRTTGGRTVVTYEQREPMASELAQVAVGRLDVTDRPPVGGVAVRDVTARPLTQRIAPLLAVERSQLAWMTSRVGPYPFPVYGTLVTDSQLGFALETQTISLVDASWFARPRGSWASAMLHELAHQWFGDSVTPRTWADVWLNEGHATWYEHLWADENAVLADDLGVPGVATFDGWAKVAYARGDTWRQRFGAPAHPRLDPARPIGSLFNVDVYDGGALVLYALRQQVGPEVFQRIERTWVTQNRGRSASTADFVALSSRVAGRDLGPFLRAWLDDATTPPMPGHPDWTSS